MKKIVDFCEKRKSIIFASVVVLIVAIAAVFLYKYEVANDNNAVIKSCTLGGITSVDDSIELSEGQMLKQSYKSVNLDYKQIGFAAQPTTDEAELEVKIFDGKEAQIQTIKKSQFTAGYTYIDVMDILKESKDAELEITFTAKKGTFVFSANKSINVEGGSCRLDEKEVNTNAVIDLRSVKDSTGDTKYIVLSCLTILFLIALIFVIKFK